MTACDQCSREQLQQLFNETLPEAIANDVADHVASCQTCQRALESFAAQRDWWDEASRRLSQLSSDIASLQIGGVDRITEVPKHPHGNASDNDYALEELRPDRDSNASSDSSDEAYATDFAVDFLEPSDNPSVLGRLGEYEIVSVIGRGGMGVVLKGFQKELHRFVAVKVLAPHLATSGAARRRFSREAQATAAVVNPHVMAIHTVHANSKLPYLVMPLVDCQSLQQRLDNNGPLDLKDVLRIGMQAALGLAAAHAQGLVHRDVKPANILLETNVDRVMLTDFGLARAVDDATLTRTGIIAGTPQYMSPEQANGDAVDHRSDLFSLGSVLYAMCTARPPFRAETTFGILRRIRETDPRPIREINADIPLWFERIVMKLLSKSPEERIPTASEVATLLEKCLSHVQQPTVIALPAEWIVSTFPPNRPRPNSLKSIRPLMRWMMLVFAAVPAVSFVARWPSTRVQFQEIQSTTATPDKFERQNDSRDVEKTLDLLFDWNHTQSELGESDGLLKQMEINVRSDLEIEPKANTGQRRTPP